MALPDSLHGSSQSAARLNDPWAACGLLRSVRTLSSRYMADSLEPDAAEEMSPRGIAGLNQASSRELSDEDSGF